MRRPERKIRRSHKSTNDRIAILLAASSLLLALGAAGAASPAHAGSVPTPALRAATLDPLTLPPELRSWAHAAVPERGTEIARLRRLHAAMLAEDGPATRGDGFATRFVALAREIGIDAYFVRVDGARTKAESGALQAPFARLAAGYGLDGRVVVFDSARVSRPSHRDLEVLTDRAAAAIVHRNAGAALLVAGEHGAAIERLETAVLLDPDVALAWSTLGVALRRTGQPDQALDAYERSLALALVP